MITNLLLGSLCAVDLKLILQIEGPDMYARLRTDTGMSLTHGGAIA